MYFDCAGLERAVRYIEHTVEHGTDLLHYSGQHLSLWQYMLLDVFAIIASFLGLILAIIYFLLRYCVSSVRHKLKSD